MRTVAATTLAFGLAVTLGACGSSGSSRQGAAAATPSTSRILQFAQCMRQHGVNMPDPSGPGSTVTIPGTPVGRQAMNACRPYMPTAPGSQQQAAGQSNMLKMAQCLRAQGINVADPKPGMAVMIPKGIGQQQLNQAMQTCNKAQ
jgi:hypothetical protein